MTNMGMTGKGRVFCIGETVLDIIFRDDQPIAAKPGGSMLNSAVSLGRAGVPVYFISDYGTDHAGDLIHGFLTTNRVKTDYISRYADGKTALALAFLDDRQNAAYSFYKLFPEERLKIPLPDVRPGDILLFGSFYALTAALRDKLTEFVRQAKSSGAFIVYDPNFRSQHLDELATFMPWIIENISLASLVRGSDEDFMHIFSVSDAQNAFRHVTEAGCPMLVYTKNSLGIEVLTRGCKKTYTVPQVRATSTIGAGDSFNAGLIYALASMTGADLPDRCGTLPDGLWDQLITSATRFSADVCQSLENYISIEFANAIDF